MLDLDVTLMGIVFGILRSFRIRPATDSSQESQMMDRADVYLALQVRSRSRMEREPIANVLQIYRNYVSFALGVQDLLTSATKIRMLMSLSDCLRPW
jgi:hypothetical protein